MAKITLNNLANLTNEQSAIGTLNNNNDIIEAFSDTVLSRNGTAPNQMGATLDMNSNRIINLPDAETDQEPVTFGQVDQIVQEILGEERPVNFVPVTQFGASPAATPTANGVAIQAAIDYAQANKKAVFVPAGTYTVDRAFTAGDGSLSIYGEGISSRIRFINPSSAGFHFTPRHYVAGVYDNLYVGNLQIVAAAAIPGSALSVVLDVRVPNAEQIILIDNVTVIPETFGTHHFTEGLRLERVINAVIRDFQYVGNSENLGTIGVYMNTVVGIRFYSPIIVFAGTGLFMDVTDGELASEGIEIHGGAAYNGKVGIKVQGDTPTSGNVLDLRLEGFHIAVTTLGGNRRVFDWDGVYQSTVSNCLFYNIGGSYDETNYPSLDMADTVGCTFTGNKIYGTLGYQSDDVLVRYRDASYNNLISNCYFALAGIGIEFREDLSSQNITTGCIFNDITTRILNGPAAVNAEVGSKHTTNLTPVVQGTISRETTLEGRLHIKPEPGETGAVIGFTPSTQGESFLFQDNTRKFTFQDQVNQVIMTLGPTPTVTVGTAGTSTGKLALTGATSGTVTVQPQGAAGTYNFNLPTTAGTSGQPLLSGGGGTSAMTFGTLGVTAGGTGITSIAQGSLLYGSASNTISTLVKDTNATRYLANTGTSNNPAWAQINLANGVTGTLSIANGGTGATTARAAMAALKGVYVLACSGASVSHTGDTNEFALATITVPAGAMGPNGKVRINTVWRKTGANAGWTARVRFGGISGTAYTNIATAGTAASQGIGQVMFGNSNSQTAQIGGPADQVNFNPNGGTALITSSIDTTVAQDIVITGQLVNASDTIALESYLVELIVP